MSDKHFFQSWPKIPRLRSPCIITEKIDGTNGQIYIMDPDDPDITESDLDAADNLLNKAKAIRVGEYTLMTFSRNRLIWPQSDNFQFARWAFDNSQALVSLLGPGRHFGEWWGNGIQRGYGKKEKIFSLFNTRRWKDMLPLFDEEGSVNITCVPVLSECEFTIPNLKRAINMMYERGSFATPYPYPEGIVIYFKNANQLFKIIIDGDKNDTIPLFADVDDWRTAPG